MIIDTSFILDLMNENNEAVAKFGEFQLSGEPFVITSLSIFELFTGIARSKRPIEEKNKVMDMLKNQIIVSLDAGSAEKAGEIHGFLVKEGQMIGTVDTMIAGICLLKNEKLLTRNLKDFSKVKGLKIESY